MFDRQFLRRLTHTAVQVAVTAAATAAGSAPVQLAIWWVTHQ
ncbi:hypothetical protein [Streptomyces sp. LUP30]|nr:hypothetical protein [Streptomyces sp. LUP30]